ncbi:MAG: hypothetical protein IPL61_32145 [Myxococcales bacterium]|nr:hypothetical protein [Myxococcales bacterium]
MTGAARAVAADAAANARGLKVHLRLVAVGGVTYRVVSPRPATVARWSTNYFHDTWHILTGGAGALVLGRLLWGLAFQRQPDTLVVIDRPHLTPTPFEADQADPIALIPAGLTAFDVDRLTVVRRRLAGVAPTTIRWHTFGLPQALAAPRGPRFDPHAAQRGREQMARRAGMVCYTAPPAILREAAVDVYRQRGCADMTYVPLAEGDRRQWQPAGEVQVFGRFDDEVAAAVVARREVVAAPARPLSDQAVRHAVWARRDDVIARRRAARARAR